MLVKPDWNKFKANFSDNPQKNFEWFSYLLFCREFNHPKGIFRFFNQTGLETNPIENNNEVIGWQAKFYEVKLSSRKEEIIESIFSIKSTYPSLTKLLFYSNQDWTEARTTSAKNKKTRVQTEIEEYCRSLQLNIEWRTKSFFESEFVCITCCNVSEFFFQADTVSKKIFTELKTHTEAMLLSIKTTIKIGQKDIHIDRNKEIERIINEKHSIIILHGSGGIGKTAIIKEIYNKYFDQCPIICFHASQFNVPSSDSVFPNFTVNEFINAYRDESAKMFVIDSAEKLIDSDYPKTISDFIEILIQNNWKVIFTTRDSYLEELVFTILDIYNVEPIKVNVPDLTKTEIEKLFIDNNLIISSESNILQLLAIPFYLNEYFKYYSTESTVDYLKFKEDLWKHIIKPKREQEFIKISVFRSNSGSYYINNDTIDINICDSLVTDGVLGKDTAGYFITHDIYEELALEKFINNAFLTSSDEEKFFTKLGSSLPVRRSYRNWVKEKLENKDNNINGLINYVLNLVIDNHYYWIDETIIAVLVSPCAEILFTNYELKLLQKNYDLLKRVAFLLQIACKESDNSKLTTDDTQDDKYLSYQYYFTKPKGSGWCKFILFIYNHIDAIGYKDFNYVISVLCEWNQNQKYGDTTRKSALLALHYYEWLLMQQDICINQDEYEKIYLTISNGAKEIKEELTMLFNCALTEKDRKHAQFIEQILQSSKYYSIYCILTHETLELAEKYWTIDTFDEYYNDIDHFYGLEEYRLEYSPSSAYQTPIYWCLYSDFKNTLDFIIRFTNRCIHKYQESEYQKDLVIVKFNVSNVLISQIASQGLWEMYRGTSNPVTPNVLQSMHMALEKYLLENVSKIGKDALEKILLYILEKSESASLAAVVTSIVLANPEIMFNVACELFRIKEYIHFDYIRKNINEREAYSLYQLSGSYNNKFYTLERLETCKQKFRMTCLEDLFLEYQIYNVGNVDKDQIEKRREILFGIIDQYYSQLPEEAQQTDDDKVWRISLCRIDYRKMTAEVLKQEGKQCLVAFKPEFPEYIQQYQKQSEVKTNVVTENIELRLWSSYKWQNDERATKYEKYEKSPSTVINEIKIIMKKLKESTPKEQISFFSLMENTYWIQNHALPADCCGCLVKYYYQDLTENEILFCKEILLSYAVMPLRNNYQYQGTDGTEHAIVSLGYLILNDDKKTQTIKLTLFLNLMNDNSISCGEYFWEDAVISITEYLTLNMADTYLSFIYWFAYLKPLFDKYRNEFIMHRNGNNTEHLNEQFLISHQIEINKLLSDDLSIKGEINTIDFSLSNISVLLDLFSKKIPKDKVFLIQIIEKMTDLLIQRNDYYNHRDDSWSKSKALSKYAAFLLSLDEIEIENYLKPFISKLSSDDCYSDFFERVMATQLTFKKNRNFWKIWYLCKPVIDEYVKNNYYSAKLIHSYLFTIPWWGDAKEWSTLENANVTFFEEITHLLGSNPATLYSLSRLLYGIGSKYLNDGISWIGYIIKNYINERYIVEEGTIFYIEQDVRRYVKMNQRIIKTQTMKKNQVITILNFLVENGSVIGYMLREDIL